MKESQDSWETNEYIVGVKSKLDQGVQEFGAHNYKKNPTFKTWGLCKMHGIAS